MLALDPRWWDYPWETPSRERVELFYISVGGLGASDKRLLRFEALTEAAICR